MNQKNLNILARDIAKREIVGPNVFNAAMRQRNFGNGLPRNLSNRAKALSLMPNNTMKRTQYNRMRAAGIPISQNMFNRYIEIRYGNPLLPANNRNIAALSFLRNVVRQLRNNARVAALMENSPFKTKNVTANDLTKFARNANRTAAKRKL